MSYTIPTWWLVSWDLMWPIGGELVTTITSPSCWGTHFLYLSNPPSGNLLPIIPWANNRHEYVNQTVTSCNVVRGQETYSTIIYSAFSPHLGSLQVPFVVVQSYSLTQFGYHNLETWKNWLKQRCQRTSNDEWFISWKNRGKIINHDFPITFAI